MANIYEAPLSERFEAASAEFAVTFSRKMRRMEAGGPAYSSGEFIDDVYAAAGNHGLFVEALWAYFRMLYDTDFV